MVVAPSLIPTRPGDHVETHRRDAVSLARLHRAGGLTTVWVPDAAHEAMGDLVRARTSAVADRRRARQRLRGFVPRHDRVYSAVGRGPIGDGSPALLSIIRRRRSCSRNTSAPSMAPLVSPAAMRDSLEPSSNRRCRGRTKLPTALENGHRRALSGDPRLRQVEAKVPGQEPKALRRRRYEGHGRYSGGGWVAVTDGRVVNFPCHSASAG